MAGKQPRYQAALDVQIRLDDKVSRFFRSHELTAGQRDQWCHGKVVGFKLDAKKDRRPEACWWTVLFDAPANKRSSCHMDEIGKMKAHAEDFRLKRLAMEEQLGKQLVLAWTEEDEALSLSD